MGTTIYREGGTLSFSFLFPQVSLSLSLPSLYLAYISCCDTAFRELSDANEKLRLNLRQTKTCIAAGEQSICLLLYAGENNRTGGKNKIIKESYLPRKKKQRQQYSTGTRGIGTVLRRKKRKRKNMHTYLHMESVKPIVYVCVCVCLYHIFS